MSNIIHLDFKKKRQTIADTYIKEEEFDAKLQRIRDSLSRINHYMAELRGEGGMSKSTNGYQRGNNS